VTVRLDTRIEWFLSARKADLKKGFQHLVVVLLVVIRLSRGKKGFQHLVLVLVLVLVVLVLVVGTRVKKGF
jgi:t-SNARE complex subunit (syntaxin)